MRHTVIQTCLLLIFFALFGVSSQALAKENCQVITKIDYQISGWVKAKALARQFTINEGDCLDRDKLDRQMQDLADRGSFKKLESHINELPDGTVELIFEVEYGWPVVPSLFYQSGAFQQFHIGAFMPSFLGNLHEFGANYTWRNHKNMFSGWYTAPNVFGYGSTMDIEIAMTANVISRYDDVGRQVPMALENKFEKNYYRWRIPSETYEVMLKGGLLDISYDVVPRFLQLSFRYLLLFEEIYQIDNYALIEESILMKIKEPILQRHKYRATMPLSMGVLTLKLGKPAFIDQYRWVGHQLNAFLVGAHTSFGSGRSFLTAAAIYRGFIPLGKYFDLILRVGAATTSSEDFFDFLNIGSENFENLLTGTHDLGLTNVRGFRPAQFRGQNILYGNVEVRARLVHDVRLIFRSFGNFTLQAALFADVGEAWNKGQFVERARESFAVSVGGGLVMTLQAFRDTYVNYYIAQTLHPFYETSYNIVMTKSFF